MLIQQHPRKELNKKKTRDRRNPHVYPPFISDSGFGGDDRIFFALAVCLTLTKAVVFRFDVASWSEDGAQDEETVNP